MHTYRQGSAQNCLSGGFPSAKLLQPECNKNTSAVAFECFWTYEWWKKLLEWW